ncbi:hypothetical protein PIIN_04626 [Serendipita indica DSM 11827]|uniref:Uncharacterized protein n=1 Tax=Serendipita indica (strain DSM 11827) TaxID=1109443 RepID=G4TH99_SERID|nr:hypothetical protein PIIN_04626 [Serendipita indica DSM 11827]
MSFPIEESPILEALSGIRNRLTALKRETADFVKPQDVVNLYQATPNRVDTTLADVFSLLSLFFLTIGRTKECPAIYSQVASIRQLLDHMRESMVYSEADLGPFQKRLAELREIVQNDAENHPPAMIELLERKLNQCDDILQEMMDALSVLSPELVPLHQKLVTMRRQFAALASKEHPSKTELQKLVDDLRKIDAKRVDGKFCVGPGASSVPPSQAICSSLVEDCFDIAHEIKARGYEINLSDELKPVYERLKEMRGELERLSLTHRWTLRETDLYNYAVALRDIDQMRKDGKWNVGGTPDGKPGQGQYVLLYLLRRCYGLIYSLLSSSEPVSEELMPIANKLSTVKKVLNEVLRYGGPFHPRELYPYQLALFQVDGMVKDGKFIGKDGSIPEGQGILKESMEENDSETEEDEDGYGEEEEEEEEEAEGESEFEEIERGPPDSDEE